MDVGSWIGPTVLLAARHSARVVAYEPDPIALTELRSNITINKLGNVDIREYGIYDQNAKLPFGSGHGYDLGMSGSSLTCGTYTVDVHVVNALDEFKKEDLHNCMFAENRY